MFHLVRAVAGSKLYGTSTHESDDDFVGIFVPSPEEKLGLSCREHIIESKDVTMYELGKYVKLAAGGNPTILQLLYTPESMWVQWAEEWPQMQQDLRSMCVSQKCRNAFVGYLDQQVQKAMGDRQQRPELVEKYGFDTKFMAHAVRLGILGRELLTIGHMVFPLIDREFILDIRQGKVAKETCLGLIAHFRHGILDTDSVLPPEPDYDRINQWLAKTYLKMWGRA